jgi:hypothetical protein
MKSSLSFSAALLTMTVACLPVRAEQAVASSADATSASAAVAAEMPAEPVTFDQVVYLARLPAPAELLKGAARQGYTIARMDQTSDRIVVVYQYSGGRTVTFAYTLLSAAANYPAPVARAEAASTAVPVSKAVYTTSAPVTQVVYTEPRTVYYTSRYDRYYDPAWDFWGPLTLGVGIGLIGGHGHGWPGSHGWHGSHGGHSDHGSRR